ncbi:hypothetical protein AAVH_11929 [Aphelenchoides avenae]|nr:hypothetical protein AAVH_11929 [Aphelenchus avenae]
MASALSHSAIRQILYLDSLELAFALKGQVDEEDVRAIFTHGKPLKFHRCPPLFVSKIVEAFTELKKEPTHLDVTITHGLGGLRGRRPSEAWPQVYTTHLPCHACSNGSGNPFRTMYFAVEKFHVSSKSFVKQLTVELHYQLEEAEEEEADEEETEREQSAFIDKMILRLTSETCSARRRLSGNANRSSARLLFLPDFASEVYGFLDRAYVGSSLLANRALYNLVCQLKQRLPVHHLKCAFVDYWLTVGHIQRDLSYTDMRRFRVPSIAGAENDCALIRRYLVNSHVADLLAPDYDFFFAIKMLADLAGRNFSTGCLRLSAEATRLSDYRSMDAVFGRMRMSELHLSCAEHRFVELVKTADFFRMPTIQALRELKLTLSEPRNNEQKPRRRAKSKSPLWVSGIYLLRNCEHYRVDYETDRHLRSIGRKMVQICEDFELGKIAGTVKHFELHSEKEMDYAFNGDNLLVSGLKVEGGKQWDRIVDYVWDVYRFRNAITSEYLTACVRRDASGYPHAGSILHISRGEIYPDASFADH